MQTHTPRKPGPDHPITIEPSEKRVTVRFGDEIVADSQNALWLHEAGHDAVAYIPRKDVRAQFLTPSSDEYFCPFKGECTLYDIGTLKGAAWSYDEPYEWVRPINGHIAFDGGRLFVTVA